MVSQPTDSPTDSGAGQASPTDARTAIAHARETLAAAGIEEAALEAEVLARHVLGVDRAQIFAHPERRLTPGQRASLEALLHRRLRREPVAYILGTRDFYGLSFVVTPAVMVPRPETETLVEEALGWARAREGETPRPFDSAEGRLAQDQRDDPHPNPLPSGERERVRGPLVIADIGTGSGCVAVSLAVHLPEARIIAIDASAAALEVAASNLQRHGVRDRVTLLHGSLLEPLTGPVDLMVANLPYVRDGEIAELQPEVRDWEPRGALAGGPDGTALLRALLAQAPAHLRPGGAVMLEMDPRQRREIDGAAGTALPGASVRVVVDLAGRDRVLVIQT
jgi:release factor glutamine methyltransferase